MSESNKDENINKEDNKSIIKKKEKEEIKKILRLQLKKN